MFAVVLLLSDKFARGEGKAESQMSGRRAAFFGFYELVTRMHPGRKSNKCLFIFCSLVKVKKMQKKR